MIFLGDGISYEEAGEMKVYIGVTITEGIGTITVILADSQEEADKLASKYGDDYKVQPLYPFLQDLAWQRVTINIRKEMNARSH